MTRRLLTAGAALVAGFLLTPLPAGAASGGITGTVTGPGGTGLGGVTVELWSNHQDNDPDQLIDSTTTDGSGQYDIAISAGVNLIVCFVSTTYVSECYDNAYRFSDTVGEAATPVTVAPGGSVIDAQLAGGGTLSGLVRSNHDVALSGVQVRAQRSPGGYTFATVSQPDGTYQFTKLPPGDYTVCASSATLVERCAADEGGPASYAVTEAGGSQSVQDLVLQVAPENVKVSGTGADRIQWSWDAVAGAHYRVAVSTSPTMSSPVIKTSAVRWATFTGLKKNTLYYVVVRAFDNQSTTKPSVKVAGKTGVVARPVGVHPENWDRIDWSWAPYAGAAKYLVKMNRGSGTWVGAEQHVVTGTKISLGVERDSCATLKVIALNQHGNSISAWSAPGEGCVPYHPV